MITNEEIQKNQIEEVFDEEASNIELAELKREMIESVRILEEAKMFEKSDTYLLLQDDMNNLYQEAFTEAYSTKDAYQAKYALERMKGIGQAMKVLSNLIIRLEDDVNNIGKEITNMEEVE